MKNTLFLLFFLALGPAALAQKYTIQGSVAEKQKGVLPSASIFLLQPGDSSVLFYTMTNLEGQFFLRDIDNGDYILKASFLGFAPYFQNISTPSEGTTLELGTIQLQPVASKLAEITVEAKVPVVVKEDTVEYNAGSFATRPNANVEQVLKQLPGVDLDRNGSIRVQGESVTRIFVDGKEFFGGNLQMATRNLPADAIDKVQVIDGKTEEALFSGIDDGRRQKVINLTLKEDRRNTGFGKAMAGVGTAGRYVTQGNYNRLDGGNMVSVMGASNNVNNRGLSTDGLSTGGASTRAGAGEGQAGGGPQEGVATSHIGGVNLSNQLTGKTRINGSYLLNHTDARNLQHLTRQNFLPEGTALYAENSESRNKTNLHNASFGLEKRDSLNTIRLNSGISFTETKVSNSSDRRAYSVQNILVNEGERNFLNRNKNLNLNADLFYGHRFQKAGRLFTVTNRVSTSRDDVAGRSASFTRFSDGGLEELRQRNEQENKNLNFSTRLTFTEPLGNKQFLQANYNLSNLSSTSDLQVFNELNETELFNPEESNRFRSGFLYQQAGMTYRLNRGAYNLAVGTNVQQATLSGQDQETGGQLKRNFQNFLPSLQWNQRFNKTSRLTFNYGTSVRAPSVNQLQPVMFRYDPLHVFVGNPDLRPEYTHQGRLNFNHSKAASGIFLLGSASLNYTTNPITASVTIDDRQVRTTQYVNVSYRSNFSTFFNLGVPVREYNSQFSLGPFLRQGQSITLLNGETGTVQQRSVGGTIGYTYKYKQYVDVNLRANLSVSQANYELNPGQNQVFYTAAYTADASLHFLQHYTVTTEMFLNRFRNARTNFRQVIPIYSFSLSRFVLPEDKGEIRLSAYNVLDRSVGATQFATLNYLEQSVQNALGNYFLLSFTFNFDK